MTFALIRSEEEYFLFDSHSRDEHGYASNNGKACLVRASLGPLVKILFENRIGSGDFVFTPMVVDKIAIKNEKNVSELVENMLHLSC